MSEKKAATPHKPATTGFWAVFDKLLDFFAILSCIALLMISFIVVADVIMRYAFSKPFGFTTPLAEMVLVCVLSFGATYLLREQDFIRVDIVVQFLPKKVRLIIRAVTNILSGVIFLLICYGASMKLIELIKDKAIIINSGGNWLHAVYAAPMVVFYLLVSIQFFRDAYQTFASIKSGAYLTEHDHDEPSLAEIMHEEKLAESAEHTEAE